MRRTARAAADAAVAYRVDEGSAAPAASSVRASVHAVRESQSAAYVVRAIPYGPMLIRLIPPLVLAAVVVPVAGRRAFRLFKLVRSGQPNPDRFKGLLTTRTRY